MKTNNPIGIEIEKALAILSLLIYLGSFLIRSAVSL